MPPPTSPHRSSLRLRGYDYSEPGLYFVTICTQAHKSLFGTIRNGKMIPNAAAHAVQETWLGLPNRFPTLELDSFIVMPNHVHAILALFRTPQETTGAASSAPTNSPPSLGKIIRVFKSLSAIEVNRLGNKVAQPVWQRNYFEHIIRRGEDLDAIRRYIQENPLRWDHDHNNPNAKPRDERAPEPPMPEWLQ